MRCCMERQAPCYISLWFSAGWDDVPGGAAGHSVELLFTRFMKFPLQTTMPALLHLAERWACKQTVSCGDDL